LITLLPAATAPGLQVKDLAGNWHDVSCDTGTIVINSGDMLKLASHDYYPSTTHRVVNPHTGEARLPRYSMPLFLHPRKDARLTEELTAGEYLDQRLRAIGLK
jgi:isopenicillin N synthase-like dioxygenase